jgi:peptide deformylase
MAVLDILTEPDARLHEVCEEATPSPEMQQLFCDMLETMLERQALGLAAPQVGILKRAIIVADTEKRKMHAVLNPRIVKRSTHRIKSREGCLSMPGKSVIITRAWSVTVEGLDMEGEPVRIEAKGSMAAAFQHEIDHLDGKTLARLAQQPSASVGLPS